MLIAFKLLNASLQGLEVFLVATLLDVVGVDFLEPHALLLALLAQGCL